MLDTGRCYVEEARRFLTLHGARYRPEECELLGLYLLAFLTMRDDGAGIGMVGQPTGEDAVRKR